MGYALKQSSTARELLFWLFDTGTVTPSTGKTPTVTIRKAGGSFATPAGAVSEVGNGLYSVAGNATDTATLGPLALYATASGSDPTEEMYEVVAYDPADAVRLGLTALPNANAGANGGLPLGDASGKVLLQAAQPGVTIPAVTDVTNNVNADVKKINGTTVTGTGILGNEWGP